MKATDLLSVLSMIESGWRPTGLGYWMPVYTEEEWERLSIEVHAAQVEPQAQLLASMPQRENEDHRRALTGWMPRNRC